MKTKVNSARRGLPLNTKKTNIMVINNQRTDDTPSTLDGEDLEEVKCFLYLSSMIDVPCKCDKDDDKGYQVDAL